MTWYVFEVNGIQRLVSVESEWQYRNKYKLLGYGTKREMKKKFPESRQ